MGSGADASTERTLFLQLKGKICPELQIHGYAMRAFKAEASLRLEGMDPSGTPLYKSVKARIISGELTYEQGVLRFCILHKIRYRRACDRGRNADRGVFKTAEYVS